MQPVHSRNVNAHTCLGGGCEASLTIASVEPDRETDKVGEGLQKSGRMGIITLALHRHFIKHARVS